MKKSNIAKTKQDWELGILKGKTVFPYGYPGNKQMTMNTPAGVVPYPLEYIGLTNGKVTDRGIAKPGDDFVVNGDTVIENKLNMSKNNNYNQFQDGGDIDSVINRLKAMKKEMKKKYQAGGGIKNEYRGSALDQAQQDVDMREATKMDTDLRNYAINERNIPKNVIDNGNTTYAPKSFGNQKPVGYTNNGYNIMQDDYAITENRDNMVQRPTIENKGLPADNRSSQSHEAYQSAAGTAKTGSGSNLSFNLPNFYNDVMPNFLNLEGRESDQNIGIFGPSGIKRMKELGYSDDELRSIRLEDLDSNHPVAKAIGTEAQRVYGLKNKRNVGGEGSFGGEDDITQQGGANNDQYALEDIMDGMNRSKILNTKSIRNATKNKLTEEEADEVAMILNNASKAALDSGQDPKDYITNSGILNNGLVQKYYSNINKGSMTEIGRHNLGMVDVKEQQGARGGKDYTTDEQSGKRLTFAQAFGKARANGEPEFTWEGQPYRADKGISETNAPKGFYDNSGRGQSGYQDSQGYAQDKIFDRQDQGVKRKDYSVRQAGIKQMGGYTNQYAQKGKTLDPFSDVRKTNSPVVKQMRPIIERALNDNSQDPFRSSQREALKQKLYDIERTPSYGHMKKEYAKEFEKKQYGGYADPFAPKPSFVQKAMTPQPTRQPVSQQRGSFGSYMDRIMSPDNMQTPNPNDPIFNQQGINAREEMPRTKDYIQKYGDKNFLPPKGQRGLNLNKGAFGEETSTEQDIPFKKYSDNPDLLQWDPNTGLPIAPDMNDRNIDPLIKTEYEKVMQRLKSPEYTDHPGRSNREVQKLNKPVFKPQMQKGGRMASYFGEIPVGDELGGNTAPSTYFNNNRNYKPQQGISDFMGKAMFMGQTGGYVENTYPTAEPNAQRNIGYGRNTNYDWNMKEVGGYGDATDPYSYQAGGYTNQGGDLPKYRPGQTIQYKCGGKIKKGVVAGYDPMTKKIKLK